MRKEGKPDTEELKRRKTSIMMRTVMDNAVTEVMYWVEDNGLRIDNDGENYIIGLLFDTEKFKQCEDAIMSGEKTIEDIIVASRNLGKTVANMRTWGKDEVVSKTHLKDAIKDLKENVWPYR